MRMAVDQAWCDQRAAGVGRGIAQIIEFARQIAAGADPGDVAIAQGQGAVIEQTIAGIRQRGDTRVQQQAAGSVHAPVPESAARRRW